MSDYLRPHELQHARPPCPSPTPRVYSNSCPSSWWCHPAISSSVIPLSCCPQSLPASGSFQWVNSPHEAAKVLEFQHQHQSFQWTPRTDFLYNGLVGSPAVQGILKSLLQLLQYKFIYLFLVLPVYCYQPVSLHPHADMLSHVTPWTAARQAPLSMDFSRQEYCTTA